MPVEKKGTPWQDDELDVIVADYFQMLEAEIAGRPYVKLRHSQRLMERIERTHRSIEFKHQNISAVLDELGMPWIPGYKPMPNYQKAIIGAVDRYLTKNPVIPGDRPSDGAPTVPEEDLFVSPPTQSEGVTRQQESLRHLVRKFDPVERDHQNRILRKAGEEFIL